MDRLTDRQTELKQYTPIFFLRRGIKRQRTVFKSQHRKLEIGQPESHKNLRVTSGAHEGLADTV